MALAAMTRRSAEATVSFLSSWRSRTWPQSCWCCPAHGGEVKDAAWDFEGVPHIWHAERNLRRAIKKIVAAGHEDVLLDPFERVARRFAAEMMRRIKLPRINSPGQPYHDHRGREVLQWIDQHAVKSAWLNQKPP